jgi:hypothetical protein
MTSGSLKKQEKKSKSSWNQMEIKAQTIRTEGYNKGGAKGKVMCLYKKHIKILNTQPDFASLTPRKTRKS